jgi:hypothetical protein
LRKTRHITSGVREECWLGGEEGAGGGFFSGCLLKNSQNCLRHSQSFTTPYGWGFKTRNTINYSISVFRSMRENSWAVFSDHVLRAQSSISNEESIKNSRLFEVFCNCTRVFNGIFVAL